MTAPLLGVKNARAVLVSDGAYHRVARGMIERSRRHCLCSLFIVDASPAMDRDLLVYDLLVCLEEAAWRGVDTRLLIGGSRDNLEIAELSYAARKTAARLGIPCRWLTSSDVRGSHAKLVICDDQVLLGSHNWSGGAFTSQTQDSVHVVSADLAAVLANEFELQWTRAEASDA